MEIHPFIKLYHLSSDEEWHFLQQYWLTSAHRESDVQLQTNLIK